MYQRSSHGPVSTGRTNQVISITARIATVADFSPGAGTSEPPVAPPEPVNQALVSSLTRAENICHAALNVERIESLSANRSDAAADFGNGLLAQISSTGKVLGIVDRLARTRLCPE